MGQGKCGGEATHAALGWLATTVESSGNLLVLLSKQVALRAQSYQDGFISLLKKHEIEFDELSGRKMNALEDGVRRLNTRSHNCAHLDVDAATDVGAHPRWLKANLNMASLGNTLPAPVCSLLYSLPDLADEALFLGTLRRK